MDILGISAFYHDSAACLVRDGDIIAAAQEERFTRKKHDHRFPERAIAYCLEEGGIAAGDLGFVAFYDKPLLKFDRLLETYLATAPRGFKLFRMGLPLWIRQKLYLPRELDRGLGHAYKGRYIFPEHHESHAASAFFPSPFEQAAILTLDGVGEWATGSVGVGRGNRIEIKHETHFPHSLGLLYSAFTYHCGFRVNSGEYKLMGLAPYGEPRFKDAILKEVLDLKEDGSFRMDMSCFAFHRDDVMTSPKFDALFGGPARRPESRLTQREMDLAASIQEVTEEVMIRSARFAQKVSGGMKDLVMAGGVALNCVGNGRLLRDGVFENIWIQPAAGDAGGALGAALLVWYQLLGKERRTNGRDFQKGSLLGPSFTADKTRAALDRLGAKYQRFDDQDALFDRIATLIASEKVIGLMQGRMEFGPRALGNRSIVGDARSTAMQSVMNLKTKFRESFRPFAPSVLREHVHDWFDVRRDEDSPYMLLVADVKADKRLALAAGETEGQGIDRLKRPRSVVPAITHVDDSARIQTVDPERHPRYHQIISRFRDKTGCPVIINTSFNVRGEPIVCTPEDAYRCFMVTNMDVLVIDDFVLLKEEQPQAKQHDIDLHLANFDLD